jgi:hypothetical protein
MIRPADTTALRLRRPILIGLATALTGLATVLAGCVTTQRILRDRGQGEVRCYLGSFERVWEATEEAVRWTGLVIEVADTAQGHLLARNYEPTIQDPERMAVDADAGERVGVFLDSAGVGLWAVEVLSRRVFALDVSARDWTPDVFQAIEARLPDSAKADTPEVAECELQRSGSPQGPATPSGAQPPGTASGGPGRQSVTSNSSRSIVPSGLSSVAGASTESRIVRRPRPFAS